MSTLSCFQVPQTGFISLEDYDALCDADARGDTVYVVLPDGEQAHLNNVIFDIPKRANPGALFRIKKGLIEGEYRNTKSARGHDDRQDL